MLRSLMQTWPDVAKPIVSAWDAAPADPVEAFAIARNGRGRPAEQWRERWEMLPQEHRDFYLKRASEDLAALGWEAPA